MSLGAAIARPEPPAGSDHTVFAENAGSGAVRIAQVGVGYWGPNLLRNLVASDKADLQIICDHNPEILAEAGRRFTPGRLTRSFDDIVADPEVEAVVIASPSGLHFRQAAAALDAGKHVFVEKPMTDTVEEALALAQQARSNGLCLMVGHTFLYNNVVEDVHARIVAGELGDLLYIYGQRLNLGRLRADADVVWSLAPHDVSIANYWLDSRPRQVSARGITCLNPQSGLAEVAFVQLDYPDGRAAHFHMSLLDPQKRRQMVVVGSEKMLVYDDMDIDRHIQIYDKRIEVEFGGPSPDLATFKSRSRAGDLVIPSIRQREPLAVEMEHFLDCVRSGATPRTDGVHGVGVMAVLAALSRSMAREGAVVPVEYPEL